MDHDEFGNNKRYCPDISAPPSLLNFTLEPPITNEMPSTTTSSNNNAITGWTYPSSGDMGEPETVGVGLGSSAPQAALAWDRLGRLAAAGTAVYAYYPTGLRASRTDSADPTQSLIFAYTSGGKLLSVWQKSPATPGSRMTLAPAKSMTSQEQAKAGLIQPFIGFREPCEAWITAPASGAAFQVGQAITFSGSTSLGTGATWTFGDGGTGMGFTTTHSYSAPGTYTVGLKVTGPPATTAPSTDGLTITVVPTVSIGGFAASPATIREGEQVNLSWTTTGATSVRINGEVMSQLSGSRMFNPAVTTTYELTASNAATTVAWPTKLTVTVIPYPTIQSFTANPSPVLVNHQATFNWIVNKGSTPATLSLEISPSVGAVSGDQASWTPTSPGTAEFKLKASNTYGGITASSTASVFLTVDPTPTIPVVTFSVTPVSLGAGQEVSLSWNVSSNVGVVTAILAGGKYGTNPGRVLSPNELQGTDTDRPNAGATVTTTTTYTLTAFSTQDGTQSPSSVSNCMVQVLYPQKPAVALTALPASIRTGGSTQLSWTCAGDGQGGTLTGRLCGGEFGNQGIAVNLPDGGMRVNPPLATGTCTYTLFVTNTLMGLTATNQANAGVAVEALPTIGSFTASSTLITTGGKVLLQWNVVGADSLSLNGTPLPRDPLPTSLSLTLTARTTYVLTATNGAGSVDSAPLTVDVTSWVGNLIYLGDRAIAEITPTGVHELHCDHLGTPILVTNGATGEVEGQQYFGPYGEVMMASAGYVPMTGFTGHLQAESNGLIYMRGRFYSPAWHRFLNSDQGADPNCMNQFAYCGGSPLMQMDPSGLVESNGFLDWLWSLFSSGANNSGVVPDPGPEPPGPVNPPAPVQGVPERQMPGATVEVTATNSGYIAYAPNPMLPNGGQAQTNQSDPTWVFWVSRSINMEGKPSLNVFQHSELVFANKSGSYVVQSGPDNGINFAKLTDGRADATALVAVGILPSNITRSDISAWVTMWNLDKYPYYPVGGNCNTFASWMWGMMGFYPVNLGVRYPH